MVFGKQILAFRKFSSDDRPVEVDGSFGYLSLKYAFRHVPYRAIYMQFSYAFPQSFRFSHHMDSDPAMWSMRGDPALR